MNKALSARYLQALISGDTDEATQILVEAFKREKYVEHICARILGTSLKTIAQMMKTRELSVSDETLVNTTLVESVVRAVDDEVEVDDLSADRRIVIGVCDGSIWGKVLSALAKALGWMADLVYIETLSEGDFKTILERVQPQIVAFVADTRDQLPLVTKIFIENKKSYGIQRGKEVAHTGELTQRNQKNKTMVRWMVLGYGLEGNTRMVRPNGWDFVHVNPLDGIRHIPSPGTMLVSDEERQRVQMEIGKRLQFERERMGLTQAQFSNKVGITRSYISRVERGNTNLTLGQMLTLAYALDIKLEDLVKGCDKVY